MVDLPGGVTSISTPGLGLLVLSLDGLRLLAADHRARAHLLVNQPERAAAAREEVLDDVLEVPRGGVEGLLERLADAAVGLLDEALELGERALEVGALGLELLDVRDGLVVLLLRERVHGAELLAAAHQPLDPLGERLALLVGQRLGGGLRLEPQAAGEVVQLALRVGGGVAHLLRGHLGAGHGLARVLQPPVDLGLLLGARLQRGGGLLAGGGAGLELCAEGVAAGADRIAGALERGGGAVGVRGERRGRARRRCGAP